MRPGDVVGERFVVERLLGEGGMASVHLARDLVNGGAVALKLFGESTPDLRARFEREAELLATLVHPGIVRYVAHGAPPDGTLYLAMEYLSGEDLAQRLERGPLGVDEALAVTRQIAVALEAAHARGIVHRDIKPANVFLVGSSSSDIRLLDFGIARPEKASNLTRAGFTLGTPDYMAPEQARGDETLTPAIDVFSLGCVVFECLVGRTPFAADTPLAVLSRILVETPPRVNELRSDVPAAVADLVERLLAKTVEARPPSAREALALVDATIDIVLRARSYEPLSESPRSLTDRERQLLCMLFVDRGFDGWDGRSLPFARSLVAEVQGRAELLVDGTMLVLLPGSGSAADQAVRAARCALALRSNVPEHDMALVTGRADLSHAIPVGELIDRGVALLAHARSVTGPSGTERHRGSRERGIPVDTITAELIASSFNLDTRGPVPELVGERASGGSRTLLGRHQAFVGREEELGTLVAEVRSAVGERCARASLVVGAQGVGKSRLRNELSRALVSTLPDALFFSARGDSTKAGQPFGLVAQALRSAFGLREGEPLETRHHKIRLHVGAVLDRRGDAPDRATEVTELLGELVGAPFPDEASPLLRAARADGIRLGDQMWRAWHAYLDAASATRPLVFVLDDLDSADLPSLSFLDAELRNLADRPLFVAAFARPEVDVRFPTLWRGRAVTRMELGPLPVSACTDIVISALGTNDPEATRRIVERSEGNPLFLEEIIRAVSLGRGDALPATAVAMVEQRLDGLAPETRRVLRAASVFGRVSWRSAIGSLCGALDRGLDAALDDLVRSEILAPRGVVTVDGELEYAFRTALVRDAAYATLTEEDRALGHDLAGRWLAERRPGEALSIAEHFRRGGQPRAAVAWFERSAEQALEGNDFASGTLRVEHAIACGAEGAVLGRLELLASECHRHAGANVEMVERAEIAREILVRGSDAWFKAVANVVLGSIRLGKKDVLDQCVIDLGQELGKPRDAPLPASAARIAHYLHFSGRHDFATRLLSAAWSESESLDRSDLAGAARAAWFHRACATRALVHGDLGSYHGHLERSVAAFERAGDVREPASERVNLGFARMELGLYEEAESTLRRALADTDALGLAHGGATARENLGAVLMRLGRLDEGRAYLEPAIETFRQQKNLRMEGNARIYLGELFTRSGQYDRAEHELETSVSRLATVKQLLPMALATLSLLRLAMRRFDDALAIADRASEAMSAVGHPDEGEALVRLAAVEARLALGRNDEARELAQEARSRLLERAGRIEVPAWRAAFLAVEENARTLVVADALGLPPASRA